MDPVNEKNAVAASVTNASDDKTPATGFASNGNVMDGGLQRGLKGRHLQMIALGGVVGYVFIYRM